MDLRIGEKTYKLDEHPNPEVRSTMVALTLPGGPHQPLTVYLPTELLNPELVAQVALADAAADGWVCHGKGFASAPCTRAHPHRGCAAINR